MLGGQQRSLREHTADEVRHLPVGTCGTMTLAGLNTVVARARDDLLHRLLAVHPA